MVSDSVGIRIDDYEFRITEEDSEVKVEFYFQGKIVAVDVFDLDDNNLVYFLQRAGDIVDGEE